MKKIVYSILCVVTLFGCEKDNGTIGYDEIALEPFIIENYYNDAKQLYLHEIINDDTHINFDNPILDDKEITKILKIIQAVYNSNTPERDTIFETHEIHGYYCYSLNSVDLKVNTASPEIENLSNNVFPTGESSLDNILNAYGFDSVKTSHYYPDFPWLTVYTQDEYNMIPIEDEFAAIESIQTAEFNKGCAGDGNNITLTRNDHSAIITFSIGTGDCPAGCLYHKYWEFQVSNGMAKFIRTY